jgi:hypothetical protein
MRCQRLQRLLAFSNSAVSWQANAGAFPKGARNTRLTEGFPASTAGELDVFRHTELRESNTLASSRIVSFPQVPLK